MKDKDLKFEEIEKVVSKEREVEMFSKNIRAEA